MKNSKKHQEEEIQEIHEIEEDKNDDLLNFIDLVNCIVFYYTSSAESDGNIDPADKWKEDAGLVKKSIPSEVDNLVKEAFLKKLKKHA